VCHTAKIVGIHKKSTDWRVIMLRHIMSIGLAMTACATFIPIKANAATLTVTPVGSILKRTNDSIDFSYLFAPTPGTTATLLALFEFRDADELSSPTGGTFVPGTNVTTVITFTSNFTVLEPVRDGIRDVWVQLIYRDTDDPTTPKILFGSGGDVVPVPEPLTLFGTATALGCGVLFKQKSSKKRVF